ncbi:hypothetical protein ZTR_07402 [Talaromyces verruculosus]|nr:hypothetical protein ZTR_07402 [Talaromyces verruculosus]
MEFARASNSGAACTCVVTEYHFHDRNDYSIEVDYFSLQELQTQFEQLLSSFREYKSKTASDLADMAAEDRENLKRKADLATSTFRASFGERLDNTPAVLDVVAFDEAINTMITWVSQVLPQLGMGESGILSRESFDDMNQCSNRLKSLTSETEERDQACLWPFIRKLKVYMRAHILSRGLILADLPGLRDLNSARQNVTERATTDAGVKEVFELARRAALSNVGIICTQSDDIRPNEARQDWPSERTRITILEKAIADQRDMIAALDDVIDEFNEESLTSTEDAQEFFEIRQHRDKAIKSLNSFEFELSHHIITFRNCKVSSELKNRYRSYPGGNHLQTFCVSNTMYSQERERPAQRALPFLTLSGILELRGYCIGIVAESNLRATTEYFKDEIPALLGSIELWIQAGSGDVNAERKQQILDTVSGVQRELDGLTSPVFRINNISRNLVSKFDEQLRRYMRQRAQQWSTSAGQASMLWQHSFHHSTYAAFCRNYGDYISGSVGYRCWNEEAISSMKNDISGLWDPFNTDVDTFLNQISLSIEEVFRNSLKVTGDTVNSDRSLQDRLNPLIATLRHRETLLLSSVETIIEDFQVKMSSVHTDALSPIRTSIVGQLMEGTYNEANKEYGTGSDRRRKKIISSGFKSLSLFVYHRRQFREKFLAISDTLQQKTKDAVTHQLAFIAADLDTLRNENVVLESERNPEFRTRLATEVTRAREDMETVKGAMNDLLNLAGEDVMMEG